MFESPGLWGGVVLGAVITLSGVWAMRVSRVKMTPEPGHEAELCERGVYRVIRHPMYSGVLVAFAMFAFAVGSWTGWLIWAGLGTVLWMKITIEEKLWSDRDPSYRDYKPCGDTCRF